MAEETVRVDSTEDLDSLIQRLKHSGSKDVVLAVPEDARSLQTLDQFNVLRREVKDAGLSVVFMGGNKTTRGLAKILGFPTREGNTPGNGGNGFLGNEAVSGNPAIYGSEPTIPFPPTPNGTGGLPGRNGNGNGGQNMPYGMPEGGYVVSPNGNNGNSSQSSQMPPPNMPSYQDLIEGVQNINPNLARNQNQPPLMQGGLNRPGDTPLSRDNMGNFLGDNPTQSFSRNRPEPGFSFSADEARDNGPVAGPMSMEEAQRLGLLGANTNNVPPDNSGFFPNETTQGADEEEALNIPYDDGDGVAAFRNRNSSGVRSRSNGNLNNGGKRNNRRSGVGIAVPVALVGLGNRVRRIINPVQPATANTPRMTADMDPTTRRRRKAASRNYGLLALLILLLVFLIAFALIILTVTNNSNNNNPVSVITNGTPVSGTSGGNGTVGSDNTTGVGGGKASVILTMKSQAVQNKSVQLLFVPLSGNAGPSIPATPQGQGNGNNIGTLAVKSIDTGTVEAKSVHPAFGSRVVSTPARGKVTIINRSAVGTGYSAGTVLFKANGINYRTVGAVSVPAGTPLSGAGGTATVEVVADDKSGDKGNLQGYSGLLSNAVAFQTGPITGGVNDIVKGVVSAEDKPDAEKQAMKQAKDAATAKLQSQYNQSTQAMVLQSTATPTCTADHDVGQDAPDGFVTDCKVSYKAYVYNKTDMVQALQQNVVTPGQQIDASSLVPDYSQGKLETKDGHDFYTLPVSYSTYAMPNVDAIKRAIANQPIKDAPNIILSQYGNVVEKVDLSGYNANKLPGVENLDIKPITTAGTTVNTAAGTATSTTTSSSSPGAIFGNVSGSVSSSSGSGNTTPLTATPTPNA